MLNILQPQTSVNITILRTETCVRYFVINQCANSVLCKKLAVTVLQPLYCNTIFSPLFWCLTTWHVMHRLDFHPMHCQSQKWNVDCQISCLTLPATFYEPRLDIIGHLHISGWWQRLCIADRVSRLASQIQDT